MLNERMKQDIGTGLDAIYTIVKGRILDEMEDTNLASKLGAAAAVLGGLASKIQSVLDEKSRQDAEVPAEADKQTSTSDR